MKRSKNLRLALVVIAALATPLMAFTLRGGDSFEIHIGNTLALQQFVFMDKSVKSIDLSATAAGEHLRVSFSHCGQTGTNRKIALRYNQQVLKEWRFPDLKSGGSVKMTIPVNDILTVQKNLKGKSVSLYYASDLLTEGKVLATLTPSAAQARVR